MKIFDIRGTHGSGKTTVAKHFVEGAEPIEGRPFTYEAKRSIMGYWNERCNLTVLGKYETACGGCDGIKTQHEIKTRVEQYSAQGSNILLEGILVAHTYEPWELFARGKDYHFIILNTPLDVCIDRVNARRAASGKGPLPNPKNVIRDWHRTQKLYRMFSEAGHRAYHCDIEHAIAYVEEHTRED